MVLVLDDLGREPVIEEVSAAGVSGVVGLRVAAVQEPHAAREVRSGTLGEQVVMRAHEAEAEYPPLVTTHDEREQGEEEATIVVVPVERALRNRAGYRVVDALRQLRSRDAGHAIDRSRSASRILVCGRNVAVS